MARKATAETVASIMLDEGYRLTMPGMKTAAGERYFYRTTLNDRYVGLRFWDGSSLFIVGDSLKVQRKPWLLIGSYKGTK